MSQVDSPPVASKLADEVSRKLQTAAAPLKLVDVAKDLRPKKVKVADFLPEVKAVLEEEVRIARAFCQPSGKQGVMRYWSRDEKQLLQDKAIEAAATPKTMSALKTELGKVVKGTDGVFIEGLIRELISEDRLFEHPPAKANGSPLFGVSRPEVVSPLAQAKHKKVLDKLVKDCEKLLQAAAVPLDELLQSLRQRLATPGIDQGTPLAVEPGQLRSAAEPTDSAKPNGVNGLELDELILKAVANVPVMSLADLRQEMPKIYQGEVFDEAVLRLMDNHQVLVTRDTDPIRFSAEQRREYVQDGDAVFTTISKWS